VILHVILVLDLNLTSVWAAKETCTCTTDNALIAVLKSPNGWIKQPRYAMYKTCLKIRSPAQSTIFQRLWNAQTSTFQNTQTTIRTKTAKVRFIQVVLPQHMLMETSIRGWLSASTVTLHAWFVLVIYKHNVPSVSLGPTILDLEQSKTLKWEHAWPHVPLHRNMRTISRIHVWYGFFLRE
jgi:hypothetical protein